MKFILSAAIIVLAFTSLSSQKVQTNNPSQLINSNTPFFDKMGIDFTGYTIDQQEINLKLFEIVRYQNKAESKLAGGLILLGLGSVIALGAALGRESFSQGPFIGSGVIISGSSIPLLISSAKNHRKMKKALAETNVLLIQ